MSLPDTLSGGFSKMHVDLLFEICHWFWFSMSRRLVWSYHIVCILLLVMLICVSGFGPRHLTLGFPCWSFGFLHLLRLLVFLKFLLLALKFLLPNCLPKDSCE